MIYESLGMTSALLGASFEGFVLDNDMIGNIYRVLRGIEINEEALGFDAICEAVLGDGHFLGHAQTMASMERDYFYPATADRDAPRTWAENGSLSAQDRARIKAKELMAIETNYLDPAAEAAIREKFEIKLP